MPSYRPMFVTSTARSGSYLIAMMMSANPSIMVASEPYLELFRSLRNALVRHRAPSEVVAGFDPASPMHDYYFSHEGLALLDAVVDGDLAIPYDDSEWDAFIERCSARAALQCAELVPLLPRLRAASYREMFDRAFDVIADARGVGDRRWVGIKDAWTIEFFAPLARAYPDARFVVILRDPRAVINSNLGGRVSDPMAVAHSLSYARHCRKYVAFTMHYLDDPLFAGRLHVLTHEQVLAEPEKKARELCDFLGVDYDDRMLDTESYYDWATGGVWQGNSTFETTTKGIKRERGERWRTMLPDEVVRMVDFTCGPDLRAAGFEPVHADRLPPPAALQHVIDIDTRYANWRTDFGDPQLDWGFELFRRALLDLPTSPADEGLVRRSFLFSDVYEGLKAGRTIA